MLFTLIEFFKKIYNDMKLYDQNQNYSTKQNHGMIPLNGACMMLIPSLWVCFSIIAVPQNGYIFHTHPGIDTSSQVPGRYSRPQGGDPVHREVFYHCCYISTLCV